MQGSYHHSEFVQCIEGLAGAGVFMMGGKEVQGHVAPVASFLRVLLHDRKQLHRRDTQFLQIRNLFDHSKEGAAVRHRNARVLPFGEAAHMQLVDDEIGGMRMTSIFGPFTARSARYESKRGPAGVRTGARCSRTAEPRWEAHTARVRIEQDLACVETVPLFYCLGPGDLICVVPSVWN